MIRPRGRGPRTEWCRTTLVLVLLACFWLPQLAKGAHEGSSPENPATEAGPEPHRNEAEDGKSKPSLLQPLEYNTVRVALGPPGHAVELIKEMNRKWEGMDNPNAESNPWETVWKHVNGGGRNRNPSSLIGTPDDPFTQHFGPYRFPTRGVPPPQMYKTFLFNPKNPFQTHGKPDSDPQHTKAHLFHPLLGAPPPTATFPSTVVPIPRPVGKQHTTFPPRNWKWFSVPKPRPRIERPQRLPIGRHNFQPLSYEYPYFHILNPRSAFTRSNPFAPGMDAKYQRLIERNSFLETQSETSSKDKKHERLRHRRHHYNHRHAAVDADANDVDVIPADSVHEPSRTFSFSSVHGHEDNRDRIPAAAMVETEAHARQGQHQRQRHRVAHMRSMVGGEGDGDNEGQQEWSDPPATKKIVSRWLENEDTPIEYKFYPLGRKGAVGSRGYPSGPRRNWDDKTYDEVKKRWDHRVERHESIVDMMDGEFEGPYGHSYNHQAGPSQVPPSLSVSKEQHDGTRPEGDEPSVKDGDRQTDDASTLLKDRRLPYLYTQGKQEEDDYKMTEGPSLDPNASFDDTLSPEVQPVNHAWPSPDVGYTETSDANVIKKEHYPAHYGKNGDEDDEESSSAKTSAPGFLETDSRAQRVRSGVRSSLSRAQRMYELLETASDRTQPHEPVVFHKLEAVPADEESNNEDVGQHTTDPGMQSRDAKEGSSLIEEMAQSGRTKKAAAPDSADHLDAAHASMQYEVAMVPRGKQPEPKAPSPSPSLLEQTANVATVATVELHPRDDSSELLSTLAAAGTPSVPAQQQQQQSTPGGSLVEEAATTTSGRTYNPDTDPGTIRNPFLHANDESSDSQPSADGAAGSFRFAAAGAQATHPAPEQPEAQQQRLQQQQQQQRQEQQRRGKMVARPGIPGNPSIGMTWSFAESPKSPQMQAGAPAFSSMQESASFVRPANEKHQAGVPSQQQYGQFTQQAYQQANPGMPNMVAPRFQSLRSDTSLQRETAVDSRNPMVVQQRWKDPSTGQPSNVYVVKPAGHDAGSPQGHRKTPDLLLA